MGDGVGDGGGVGDDVGAAPPQAARSIARSILQASRTKLRGPCRNRECIKNLPPQIV